MKKLVSLGLLLAVLCQSLTGHAYTLQWTLNIPQTVQNTTTPTNVVPPSSNTVLGGVPPIAYVYSSGPGALYHVRFSGTYSTTLLAPSLNVQFQVKDMVLGTVVTVGGGTLSSLLGGASNLPISGDLDFTIYAAGPVSTSFCTSSGDLLYTASGLSQRNFMDIGSEGANVSWDTTNPQQIMLVFTWGTASASNVLHINNAFFYQAM
jgi:hypothetical protein